MFPVFKCFQYSNGQYSDPYGKQFLVGHRKVSHQRVDTKKLEKYENLIDDDLKMEGNLERSNSDIFVQLIHTNLWF